MKERQGPCRSKAKAAVLAALALAGCGLAPEPAVTESRIAAEWQAIEPIEPGNPAAAFLDSGSATFLTDSNNVFEFSGASGRMAGGMGPHYDHFSVKVNSKPANDSTLEIQGRGGLTHLVPFPPKAYRKDTTHKTGFPYIASTFNEALRMLYPSDSGLSYGLFILSDGKKLIVIEEVPRPEDDWGNASQIRAYLEPYGMVYLSSYSGNPPMGYSNLQFWLDRWNGQALDKAPVFGEVKGLMEAYKEKRRSPDPTTE